MENYLFSPLSYIEKQILIRIYWFKKEVFLGPNPNNRQMNSAHGPFNLDSIDLN